MKILVIGGGGREHALCWALRKSTSVEEIVCAPGNAGIAAIARCVPIDVGSVTLIRLLVAVEQPGLVVIGPEVPLAAGVVDALQKLGVKVFGPTQGAALLETSKGFAKAFMMRWEIPTAGYFLAHTLAEVTAGIASLSPKLVVKADGLAAGKGVILCDTHEMTLQAAAELFSGSLGMAVDTLVVEEMLEGPEVSYFAICDGTTAVTLGFAQDHKRIGEGDTGPNTGGMGAYSTDTLVSAQTAEWMHREVAQRVVDGMLAEGNPFSGILFTGFMMTPAGPKVLEFNTRFGDPETEALLLRLDTDLCKLLLAAVDGRVDDVPVKLKPGASACVIAASAGYPGKVINGKPIDGLAATQDGVEVFHAGTASKGNAILTAGGRVLAVSAAGPDLAGALDSIYSALKAIHFEGMQYRRDIGWQALRK